MRKSRLTEVRIIGMIKEQQVGPPLAEFGRKQVETALPRSGSWRQSPLVMVDIPAKARI